MCLQSHGQRQASASLSSLSFQGISNNGEINSLCLIHAIKCILARQVIHPPNLPMVFLAFRNWLGSLIGARIPSSSSLPCHLVEVASTWKMIFLNPPPYLLKISPGESDPCYHPLHMSFHSLMSQPSNAMITILDARSDYSHGVKLPLQRFFKMVLVPTKN